MSMRRITFGLVLVFTSLSASLQQPAGAAVVCTGTGVPVGCVVARPRAVATPGVGAPGVPAAGAPGYGAAGRGANVNGGVNRAGRR